MKGHIRKRSKNSWTIVYDLPVDTLTGKRRQKTQTIKGTKRNAERVLREILISLEQGYYIKPNKFGTDSVDFSNPVAVRLLNKALLADISRKSHWNGSMTTCGRREASYQTSPTWPGSSEWSLVRAYSMEYEF